MAKVRNVSTQKVQICSWSVRCCWHYHLPLVIHPLPRHELKQASKYSIANQRRLLRQQVDERQAQVRSAKGIQQMSRLAVVQRYFTRLYSLHTCGLDRADHYVYMHSNRVCLVGLASSHAIFARGLTIASIRFTDGERDLTEIKARSSQWTCSARCHTLSAGDRQGQTRCFPCKPEDANCRNNMRQW